MEAYERELRAAGPVLVTGATGFVGGHLARSLVRRGLAVRGTGRSLAAGLALQRDGVDFRPVDLRDGPGLIAACEGVRVVVHSGALVSAWAREADYEAVNIGGTENLIAACEAQGVRRLVYVSTPSVSTRQCDQIGLSADDPLPEQFVSPYARTKKIGEDRVREAGAGGLETVIIRPKAIYGPGDTSIVPRFVEAARKGRLARIRGCSPVTNLTHVSDVVQGIERAMVAERAPGHTYYITGGEDVPLWDVVDALLTRLDLPLPERELPLSRARRLAWLLPRLWRGLGLGGEPPLSPFTLSILAHSHTYDITAAREDLGFEPRVVLDEGLEQVIEALRALEEGAHGGRPAAGVERGEGDREAGGEPTAGCPVELLQAGSCRTRERWIKPGGGSAPLEMPALFALIHHPSRGPVLFDTGYSPRFFDGTRALPLRLYRLATPVTVSEADTAAAQLAARGIAPADVGWIVVSHFDPDHIGGLRDFPAARVVCAAEAWAAVAGKRGLAAARARLLPGHLPEDVAGRLHLLPDFSGPPVGPFAASHDLFGDGTVRLVALPGHAPGQVGAFVTRDDGARLFLAADACWHGEAIAAGRHGAHRLLAHDRARQRAVYDQLRALAEEHPEITIVPSHCPDAAARLVRPLALQETS